MGIMAIHSILLDLITWNKLYNNDKSTNNNIKIIINSNTFFCVKFIEFQDNLLLQVLNKYITNLTYSIKIFLIKKWTAQQLK